MNKVFNPFKPHIVEFASGKFAIRKFTWCWKYYDNQRGKSDEYWWFDPNSEFKHRYEVDSIEIATTLLEICNLRKTIQSRKVLKVYQ